MPDEGTIIRNPSTGERRVWKGGGWQPLGGIAPTPAPSAPTAPVPTAPTYPGVIMGRPDPMKASAEQRAIRDQQLQEEANRRANAAEDRANRAEARAATKDDAGTVEQGKASGFLLRALQANDAYEAQRIGARSYVGQKLAENAPDALNSLPESIGNSPRRQVSDANQDDFIAATLRYESGAAIPPAEIEAQRRRYFPMPGDTEDMLKAKSRLRATAIDALKQSAGPLADQTYQRFLQGPKTEQAPEADGLFGGVVTDDRPMAVTVTDDSPNQPPPNSPPPSGGDKPTSFWQGVGESVGHALTNLQSFQEAMTGQNIAAAIMGQPTLSQMQQHKFDQMAADSPYKGSRAGRITGDIVATLPTVLLTKNPAAAGALAGAITAENPRSALSVGGSAAAGALLGKGTDMAIGAGRSVLSGFGRRGAGALDEAVVEAGQRQNIPIRQPDARPELTGKYAAAESGQHSGPIIRSAREADRAAIENRVAEIGGDGVNADNYALGQSIQGAGERYIARTKAQANRLYDTARTAAGGVKVTPRNADAVIETHLNELRAAGENSNAAAIKYLEGLQSDIDRGLSLESMQNLRTNMRGQIGERGLTGTDTERRVSQIIDAMNQDLTEQLPQSASDALRAADSFYRQKQTFIDDTLAQFMGSRGNKLPPETAAKRLISMAQGKGNHDRFAGMWRELEPAERADVSATIAASLGRARNGEFSVANLVTSLDPKSGINPRTAKLVFGEDGVKALNDLRIIAGAKRDAMNRLSPSGQAIASKTDGLKTLILGALGFSTAGPTGAIAAAMSKSFVTKFGEERAARLLLNPDFTRWVRAAPESTNPKVINRYFERLASLPSIAANDNQAFTNALIQAVKQSPGSAAAQNEPNGGGEPPQNYGP